MEDIRALQDNLNAMFVLFMIYASTRKNLKIKTKVMTREELTNYVRNTNPKIRETAYKTFLTKFSK